MRMASNDKYSMQTNIKRGVTFDAMETLERNSNCIDKLTSLVSYMKMVIDRNQSPYKPRIYQGRSRKQNRNWQNFSPRNRSPLVEEEIRVEVGETQTMETTTDPIIEINPEADGTIIGQVIGAIITRLTIGKVILDLITDKMLSGHLGTEVKVEIELEITQMIIPEVEVEIDIMTGLFSHDKIPYLMEEMILDLSPTLG